MKYYNLVVIYRRGDYIRCYTCGEYAEYFKDVYYCREHFEKYVHKFTFICDAEVVIADAWKSRPQIGKVGCGKEFQYEFRNIIQYTNTSYTQKPRGGTLCVECNKNKNFFVR